MKKRKKKKQMLSYSDEEDGPVKAEAETWVEGDPKAEGIFSRKSVPEKQEDALSTVRDTLAKSTKDFDEYQKESLKIMKNLNTRKNNLAKLQRDFQVIVKKLPEKEKEQKEAKKIAERQHEKLSAAILGATEKIDKMIDSLRDILEAREVSQSRVTARSRITKETTGGWNVKKGILKPGAKQDFLTTKKAVVFVPAGAKLIQSTGETIPSDKNGSHYEVNPNVKFQIINPDNKIPSEWKIFVVKDGSEGSM